MVFLKFNKYPDIKPDEETAYLCFTKSGGLEILSYSKDLYKTNDYDFMEYKGQDGFFQYNSEWGDFYIDDVLAWAKIPTDEEILNEI